MELERVRYGLTEEAEALNRLNYSWCVQVSLFKSDDWCDVHFRKVKEVCLIIRTRFSCPQRGVCERVRSKSWSFPISFHHLFIECTIKSGRHSYKTVKLSQRRLNYYQAHWCQFLVFVSKFKIAVSHRVLKFHAAQCPFKVACRVTHKLQIQQQVCYHTSFFASHFPSLIRGNLCGLFTWGPVVSSCACCAAHESAARIWCNTTHLPPFLLLLSSSPCFPKIDQLWTMWPQVDSRRRLTPTHIHRQAHNASYFVAFIRTGFV